MHSAPHGRPARAAAFALICSILTCGGAVAAPHAILRELMSRDTNQPPTDAFCRENFGVPCYSPQEMRTAYGMNGLISSGMVGAGETIVIIDSYGSPTIAADLAAFDAGFGLPTRPRSPCCRPSGRFPGIRLSIPISPVGPPKRRSMWSGRTPWLPVRPSC